MRKIRKNTFETNSSSTHSLVIVTNHSYMNGLKALFPEEYESIQKKIQERGLKYTQEEVKESFEKIGATLVDGCLDLTNVDPKEFDFGYVDFTTYTDAAHKILFVLTMYEDEYCYVYDPEYYMDRFKDILLTLGIHHIKKPKDGYTGIDHQSRDEIIDQVKYDVDNFVSRRDYVLVLDHD